jgi:PAS domain S-box-containing protein
MNYNSYDGRLMEGNVVPGSARSQVITRTPVLRYSIAVGAVGAALLLSFFLRSFVEPNPFIFFFAAVALSAGYGGFRAGLLATILSILLTDYFFIPPYILYTFDLGGIIRLGIFALIAALISWLSVARQRADIWWRITLASIGDAVIVTDARAHVIFMNRAAETLTGWALDEIQGKHVAQVFQIINADTRHVAESPVERVLRAGVIVGITDRTLLVARDGTERLIDDSGAPIRDNVGRVNGVILVFRDITERDRAHAALRRSEERYRAFVAQSSEGIWCFELERPIALGVPIDEQIDAFYEYAYLAECNDAMARMYGYSEARELIGARLGDFLVRSDPQNLAYLRAFIEADYRLVDAESHEIDRYGNARYFLNNLVGNIEGGLLVRAWGSQRDITELKHVGEALEKAYAAEQAARREAEEALRAREQFLSVASHELKTPLTSLMGNLQLMERRTQRESSIAAREARTLGIALAQAQRLNKLITSLLDISRIEQGQLTIQPVDLDICGLTRQVVEEMRPTLEQRLLILTCPDEPLVIRGDSLRLEQVLQNLIQNAAKYSPDDAAITIEVRRHDAQVAVAVFDRGIGIPAAALPRLFQRFFRATNVEEQQISGLGIGLYVIKEIVSLHGGRIEVDSTEGQGSTFTVTFSLAET